MTYKSRALAARTAVVFRYCMYGSVHVDKRRQLFTPAANLAGTSSFVPIQYAVLIYCDRILLYRSHRQHLLPLGLLHIFVCTSE